MLNNSEKNKYLFLSQITEREQELLKKIDLNINEDFNEDEDFEEDEDFDDEINPLIRKYALIFLVGMALVLFLFTIFVQPPVKHWLIGIEGSVVLTFIEGIMWGCLSDKYDKEPFFKANTFLLPVLLILNIIFRLKFGETAYALIFGLFECWLMLAIGINLSIGLEKYASGFEIFMNLVFCVIPCLPWNFTLNMWQWIIGIGGVLIITELVSFITHWLEDLRTEDELDKLLNRYPSTTIEESEASSFVKEAERAAMDGPDSMGFSSSEIVDFEYFEFLMERDEQNALEYANTGNAKVEEEEKPPAFKTI